ncbi:MAG: amidohydrolase family protein [Planctomycetota bacterium]
MFRAVLSGNVTLYVQAFTAIDMRTAVFLKEEMKAEGFGDIQMWLDGTAEAWKDPQLLQRSGTGVVLPPFPSNGYSGEGSFFAWFVAKDLDQRGIPFALSAHGETQAGRTLADQAGRAMRGGLEFEKALAAVTLIPARVLGLEDRLGSVEVGKDADLVLWSGPPFELTSRVLAVWVSGETVPAASTTPR